MSIQVCRDTSDAVALYLPQRLYLKSYSKLNISVQLPTHKVHGKSISNWELMEKLRKMIQPDNFSILKVSKHSSEVIRFEAELESRGKLERVMARLEGRIIQLNDYPDPLKVRVSEAKTDYPSRHSWDSFFRDSTDMDEMKPGERPDTVHIKYLPIRWFVHHRERDEDAPPSESIFKKVFEKYGAIRQVDVPASDPFRLQMKEAMRGITMAPSESGLYFEGYIQYSEYVSFVRCMDALRGKKLVRKNDDLAEWCSIHVEFDKTKHMTDAAVKRRAIVRERLFSRRKAVEEEERMEKERIAKREAKEREKLEQSEKEKLAKMKEREERRKKKQLAKLMERDDVDLAKNITDEQKRLLKAQKRLQAVRLIEELFKRIELRPDLQRKHSRAEAGERAARARIVDSVRRQHERIYEEQRERLKSALDGRIIIRSALETKKPKRETSVSSISSDDLPKRVKTEKLTTPEREMEYNRTAGMYPMASAYGFGYPAYAAVPPPGYPFQTMYYGGGRGYMPPHNPNVPANAYAPYEYRRGRGRARGRGRGPRVPYFDGPDASLQYYQYFKKLTENESRNEHDDRRSRSRRRSYSRTRSRSRSRRRSYSRSRSRSRRRSYTRLRSRSRRRSRSRSRSKSRRKSRSRSKRTRSKSRSKSRARTPSLKPKEKSKTPRRSKSWSLPKDTERKSWSKSPQK